MMKQMIILMLVFLVGCTNDVCVCRKLSFFYEGFSVEHNISTTCDAMDMEYRMADYNDTIFVPDSTFDLLVSVFDINGRKPCKLNSIDCYGAIEYKGERLYLNYWYTVLGNNRICVNIDDCAFWRYTIRCLSGYYNDFWDYNLLQTDKDIKQFGMPKNLKIRGFADSKTPFLSKKAQRKLLIIDKDSYSSKVHNL